MTKKLRINEAVTKDAVLRNKANSISATYHLMSRRRSKGLGSHELATDFVFDCRTSRDSGKQDTRARGFKSDNSETETVKNTHYAYDEQERLVGLSGIPDENDNNSISGMDQRDLESDKGSMIAGFCAGPNRSPMEYSRLRYPDFRMAKPLSRGKNTQSSSLKFSEEYVTVDRKGKGKVHSTTAVTFPRCTLNSTSHPASVDSSLPKSAQRMVNDIASANDVTSRESYKNCLQKLRSQRIQSASKGILKASVTENPSRAESLILDGENTPDDTLSTAHTLPTDDCDVNKRQSSASVKSVRFHLCEEDEIKMRSKFVGTQKTKRSNSTAERLVLRKLSAEKTGRKERCSGDSQMYAWRSSSSKGEGIDERIREIQIIKGSGPLLGNEYQPATTPPNSAQGYRWGRLQNATSDAHTRVMYGREPSKLSNLSGKTRKQILDRYKVKIKNGDGGGGESLVVNVRVVDYNPTLKTNKCIVGEKTRSLGNIMSRSIILNPTFRGRTLPPATQTNTQSLTTPGSSISC